MPYERPPIHCNGGMDNTMPGLRRAPIETMTSIVPTTGARPAVPGKLVVASKWNTAYAIEARPIQPPAARSGIFSRTDQRNAHSAPPASSHPRDHVAK